MAQNPFDMRRCINERIFAIESSALQVWQIEDRLIPNTSLKTSVRLYLPSAQNRLPMILFIHGGGFLAGSVETHDSLARILCQQVGAIVVSVEYTTAPEGKFPIQLEQCYDALVFATTEFIPSKIAVVGDSAGGNIAAALCLVARDRKGPRIDLQVLINPCLDLTCNGFLEPQGDDLDTQRYFIQQYVHHSSDVHFEYASPLLAKSFSDLPPACILVGELDLLRSQGEQYASKLKESQVEVQLFCQMGVGHLAGQAARVSSQAKESIDVAIEALRKM